jgi:uncharacterized protein (TIGR03067 family)
MIEGTWIPIEAELAGNKLAAGALSSFELVIRHGTYEVPSEVGKLEFPDGDDAPAMDVIATDGPNKGKTFPSIYELESDILRICYDLSGKARPTSFATEAGTRLFLVKYRRKGTSALPPA